MKKSRKYTRSGKSEWKIYALTATVLLLAIPVFCLLQRRAERREIAEAVARYALKHKVPVKLVDAVIARESSFDPRAVGKAGEIGLMQLMPPGKPGAAEEWARVHNVKCPSREKLFNIDTNVNIGVWYLGRALKKWEKYRCAEALALIEYNGGHKYSALCKPESFDGDVISRIGNKAVRQYVTDILKRSRSI